MRSLHAAVLASVLASTATCKKPQPVAEVVDAAPLPLPNHIAAYSAPKDKLDSARCELGRELFFDGRLSRDGTISCATCHDPQKLFTDGLARGRGLGGK